MTPHATAPHRARRRAIPHHQKATATCIALLALALLGDHAAAGSQQGRVTNLIFRASDGLVYFHLEGTPSARPPCAANQTYWIISDEKSDAGKRQIAMLLAARTQNTPIHVIGTNACERWDDSESVNTINF